jgi:ankyrin repeat protein
MRSAIVLCTVVVAACAPSSSAPQCLSTPAPARPPVAAPAATPAYLFAAIRSNDAALVEELLRASPALAEAKTERGTSALLVALFRLKDKEGFFRREDNAILQAILARRPALDRFEAAAVGDAQRVKDELARDPSFTRARSPGGGTPLHLAAFAGNLDVARVLLDAGAEVNALADNEFKNTPLQVSALTGQVDVARLLLARGADAKAKQAGGFTALHEAALSGNRKLLALLLDAGADPKVAAEDGRTPIDMAKEKGDRETVSLLAARTR